MTRLWVRVRLWFETRCPASALVFSVLLYVFLTLITVAIFLADTVDYAASIVARFQGKYYEFWDFGHILWRPMGWAITRSIEIFSPDWVKTNVPNYHVILTLIVVSWLAGFATLYLFHRLACFVTKDFWYASLSTVGFATAQAFLNFVQAGTAYIAGLAMLMLAVYTLYVCDNPDRVDRTSALGGIALAGAVLFWFPYVLRAGGPRRSFHPPRASSGAAQQPCGWCLVRYRGWTGLSRCDSWPGIA